MEREDLPHTISHRTSFERPSLSPAHSISEDAHSNFFSLSQNNSFDNLIDIPTEDFQASSMPQSPFPDFASRGTSPAMEAGPARKTNAPGTLDLDLPVTYTPTTHRISKAKKGKKVHVCEYGCGKVFTRAEHRKRHEANHSTDPLYKCHIEGCHKPFQRADLLNRHLERQHGLNVGVDPSRRRASSVSSSVAGSSVTGSPAPGMSGRSQHSSPALLAFSNPSTPSFGQTGFIEQGRARAYSHPRSSWNEPLDMPLSGTTRSFTPDYVHEVPSAEPESMYPQSGFYTSDIRQSGSGVNASYASYQKPTTLYASEYPANALTASYNYTTQIGLGLDLGMQYSAHTGHTRTSYAGLDSGSGQHGHRLTNTSELGTSDVVTIDEQTRLHYTNCYWETVDPILTVIHYATFAGSVSNPGLRDVVCAIGAQASPRKDAREHSIALFDQAFAQCQHVIDIPDALEISVDILQLVFLVEYLALYRSRTPGVYISRRFSILFNSLLSSAPRLHDRAEFYSPMINDGANTYAQEFHLGWIDLETRRRLLAACIILDMHRAKLFEQRPISAETVSFVARTAIPSSSLLWTTTNAEQWHNILRTSDGSQSNTPFHFALAHALSLHTNGTISTQTPPDIVATSLQLATHTPVRQLLITAAGSWLLNRKVSEPNWQTAKLELRSWITTQDSAIATWLAGKVIRTFFAAMPPSPTPLSQKPPTPVMPGNMAPVHSRPGIVRLETQWCLYLAALVLWAFTLPPSISRASSPAPHTHTPRSQSLDQQTSRSVPAPIGVPSRSQTHPLAQMTPLSPPVIILPSQPAIAPAPPTPVSETTSQSGGQLKIQSKTQDAPTKRRQQKLAAAVTGPTPLARFLARLDTPSWKDVDSLRGTGGVAPVLGAVRTILLREGDASGATGLGQEVVLEMGAGLAEAVAVLGRLENGRGGGF